MGRYQFPDQIRIGHRVIGSGCEPFLIAELSGNHQQSYELAEKMIEAAAQAGAHAIKLQTYTPESMTLDSDKEDFLISEENSIWFGQRLYNLYAKSCTPYEWHEALFAKAKSLGLLAFSSPFDLTAVDFLDNLNVPCFKVASFENNDLPLLKRIAQTGKPVLMSCGMASKDEIDEALECLQRNGCKELVLLKCTSAYPSPPQDMNLATILDMKSSFACPVGLSDHSTGIEISLAATALGVSVIEKHFVLSRSDGGVDAEFSIEPDELRSLAVQTQRIHKAIGSVNYGDNPSDIAASRYRRSIYIAREIKAGEKVTDKHLKVVRPANGLHPRYLSTLLGKHATRDLSSGESASLDMFE